MPFSSVLQQVMLHLRRAGLLDLTVTTAAGATQDACLDWWEQSERRSLLKKRLLPLDGVNTDDIIMDPDRAKARGLVRGAVRPIPAAVRSVMEANTMFGLKCPAIRQGGDATLLHRAVPRYPRRRRRPHGLPRA